MDARQSAVEARDLVKDFDDTRAVDGVSLAVPEGSIYGILGPNGAGKTTSLRMLLGIIDPTSGERSLLGHDRPLEAAHEVGYLPEERGLYPAMTCVEAIAFMGALRGLPLSEGRKRGARAARRPRPRRLGQEADPHPVARAWRRPSNCSAPSSTSRKLIVLDEPFSGLDAINQEKLEQLIRHQAADGVTVIFSTHVIAHAERLCERVAIIARGKVAFEGAVDEARDRLRPIVHLRTRAADGPWRSAHPRRRARRSAANGVFELPAGGPEPLLKALIDGGAGIETLSIERPGLHDAFVAIAGEAAAREMGDATGAGGGRMRLQATDPLGLRHRPPRLHRDGDEQDLPAVPARAAVPGPARRRRSAASAPGSTRKPTSRSSSSSSLGGGLRTIAARAIAWRPP